MRTVAIIQAHMGSTRLPGKVMKTLCGKSVLGHVIERVRACQLLDEIVIAISINPADNVIVAEAQRYGVRWFRGSEVDVLERYYLAAKQSKAEIVARITSDCPLFDSTVLTEMLNSFNAEQSKGLKVDYLSNTLVRSYPRGFDIEIFTFAALEQAFKQADKTNEREHVTPYIYNHPQLFSLRNQINDEDISTYRLTLDTEEDFKLIKEVYAALYKEGEIFSTQQVLQLLKTRPDLANINAHVEQKELS